MSRTLTPGELKQLAKIRKGRKMDRYTVSDQPWELQYVKQRMEFEGIVVDTDSVKFAKKSVGRSRTKIYEYLRTTY